MESYVRDASYVSGKITIPRDHLASPLNLPFPRESLQREFKIEFILQMLLLVFLMSSNVVCYAKLGVHMENEFELMPCFYCL